MVNYTYYGLPPKKSALLRVPSARHCSTSCWPTTEQRAAFYVLLTMHPCVISQIGPNRWKILLNVFISLLYVFRAFTYPSSGENYCIYATLVFVTLYGWRMVCRPYATHTEWRIPVSHRYIIFSWWWARECPKYVLVQKRNKYIKQNCAPSWTYLRNYTEMRGQQNMKYYTQ